MLNKYKEMDKSKEDKIRDMITRARVQMLINMPFFGILILNLEMEISYTVDTAATDGKKIYFNPYFVENMSEGEVNWLLIHEVMHPALKHLYRKGDRLHKKWNVACDYAIHDVMMQYKETLDKESEAQRLYNAKNEKKKKSLLEMPKGGLYNKDYKNKGAEEIYDLLPDSLAVKLNILDDHGLWEDAVGSQDGDEDGSNWDGRLINAAQAAEGRGKLPAFLKRLVGKLTKPQRDWRSLLNEFVQPEIDDYSFNPPDRRYSESDFFLPDFNDESISIKKMLFWVDTSGSISEKELTTFYSEIVGAVNQFADKLTGYIGFFDAEAYTPTEFENVTDILKIKPQGGGGTDFVKPLEYTKEHFEREDVTGIVYLTDGCAPWPEERMTNGIPVLWVITNEQSIPPWGLHTTLKI